MILLCPRCGADLSVEFRGEWFRTREQCPDCGVALQDPPGMLRPSDDEVEYGLDEWLAADRAAVTAALAALDAPYRWEPGLVLVVPAAAESDVDRLLDDIEGAEVDGGGPAGEDETAGADLDGIDGIDGIDGGEEAQVAMGELFLAADRLQHVPWDKTLAADVRLAADAVTATLPPYGVEPAVWRKVQTMGDALAQSASEDIVDDEKVAEAAKGLRDVLRAYV